MATATELVILVDADDKEIGTAEKMHAHREQLCHRAFSVFVLRPSDDSYEVLLQQRAAGKYHSAGLWTNTCCSHPRPGEEIVAAGERRLWEEMGIKLPLKNHGKFHYIAHFDNGLSENELDHVLVGMGDVVPVLNPNEVQAYKWMEITALKNDLKQHPLLYTPWLAQALFIILQHLL